MGIAAEETDHALHVIADCTIRGDKFFIAIRESCMSGLKREEEGAPAHERFVVPTTPLWWHQLRRSYSKPLLASGPLYDGLHPWTNCSLILNDWAVACGTAYDESILSKFDNKRPQDQLTLWSNNAPSPTGRNGECPPFPLCQKSARSSHRSLSGWYRRCSGWRRIIFRTQPSQFALEGLVEDGRQQGVDLGGGLVLQTPRRVHLCLKFV